MTFGGPLAENAESVDKSVPSAPPIEVVVGYIEAFGQRILDQLSSASIWYQFGAILGAIVLGFLLGRPLRNRLEAWLKPAEVDAPTRRIPRVLASIVIPVVIAFWLWVALLSLSALGQPMAVVRIALNLLLAWIVIRAVTGFVRDPLWSRLLAGFALFVAALNILRLLGPLLAFLEEKKLPLGEQLSLLDAIKAGVFAVVLIWAAALVARVVESRVRSSNRMTPSVRGLFGQLIRIAIIGAAVVFALGIVGINLTAFAVFTGALGVGIGFGLQSIFSNFVAGILIIIEKTLKVGDFVDLESGVRGEVREINIRSTLITTNDNIDVLVPNSEFINNRVTNWTLRETLRRIHVPFGVAYGTDKDLVKKAVLEAAAEVPHTLKTRRDRSADVWLVNFGDSSLDFELVVWLTDEAAKRPARVHADYCWAIETALNEYDIVIPFPQRDLHIIPPGELAVTVTEKQGSSA